MFLSAQKAGHKMAVRRMSVLKRFSTRYVSLENKN